MNRNVQTSVTALFNNKNVVILGVGITGFSCARFLHRYQITFAVNDNRATAISPGHFKAHCADNTLVLGYWDHALISSADILIVSPGIDLHKTGIQPWINENSQVFGDIELFCRISNMPIIAVTGSNGKSTVVSMLYFVGDKLNKRVLLGGNVGLPILDQIDNADAQLVILELSSFQLETITSMKSRAATILNISDDHLDRHLTFENYSQIKQKVYQQAHCAIYNRDDMATKPVSSQRQISFGSDQPAPDDFGITNETGKQYLMHGNNKLIAVDKLPLKGTHNALNYLAVLALGVQVGWDIDEMMASLLTFKGLAHRCEVLESDDGICWINDSKATNVGATLAAIKGLEPTLGQHKLILIAGGDGKGADFDTLKAIVSTKVSYLITLGKDGPQLAQLVAGHKACISCQVKNLAEAVAKARAFAKPGDIVLLSPACASTDMYTNYLQRGADFIKNVLNYKEVT